MNEKLNQILDIDELCYISLVPAESKFFEALRCYYEEKIYKCKLDTVSFTSRLEDVKRLDPSRKFTEIPSALNQIKSKYQ